VQPNRSVSAIVRAWRQEIETKLEAGATPFLPVGAPNGVGRSVPTLLALQTLSARRVDLTQPLLPAGGSGALFAAALLAPLGRAGVPEPTVVFTGPDPATHAAALATLTGGGHAPAPAVATGTPAEAAGWLSPCIHPGAAAPWEALPLTEVGEQLPAHTLADVEGELPAAASGLDWMGYGGILLALCLVLTALLI
jgi:hypothetical protein